MPGVWSWRTLGRIGHAIAWKRRALILPSGGFQGKRLLPWQARAISGGHRAPIPKPASRRYVASPKEQETLTWLSHWRGVEEVRQLAQAWNQLRAEKHWNRASQQANRPTRSVLNPTRETGESLTWMASWPDPFVTDGERKESSRTEKGLTLWVNNHHVQVRPAWISVHVDQGSRSARLFASSEIPHTLEEADRLEPFLVTTKTSFLPPDVLQTELLHYFVGFVGDVGPTEDDVLWPNQVLHRDRVLFNARDGNDIAEFLSVAEKNQLYSHADNLRRLAQERGYHPRWCLQMLCLRWGNDALKTLDMDMTYFVT